MIPILNSQDLIKIIDEQSLERPYFAMFSSLYGGITLNPAWMLLPIDDHMVHRGDGVFEAIKFIHDRPYMLRSHLERLLLSGERLGLVPYAPLEKLEEIILATIKASQKKQGLLRVFMSRGPGSFSVNPYDTKGTQFFVVVTALTPPAPEKFSRGAVIGRSQVEVKPSWMAQVKSCNYLPNVMMKKEAVDRGLDFVVGFDEQGFLAESATENIVIVSSEGWLLRPRLQNILRGTTMVRTFELAEALVAKKLLSGVREQDLNEADLVNAKEVMMLGTTLDVLPVTEFERKQIGTGQVGPVAQALLALMQDDQATGK